MGLEHRFRHPRPRGGTGLTAARGTVESEPVAVKISGSAEVTYARRDTLGVPDAPGHELSVGRTTGKNRNTGKEDYFADADVVNVETTDLVRGTGSHNGYYTMGKGADTAVAQWQGKVVTTMAADQRPMTSFSGTWRYIHGAGQYAGIKGSGTYKGQFVAADRYSVTWEGGFGERGEAGDAVAGRMLRTGRVRVAR